MKLRSESGKISTFFNIILVIVAGVIISHLWHTYKINDFSNFQKAEYETGTSNFSRDDITKYSDIYSYRIDSTKFNDALIYKSIEVEKNTVYRVTAMVKFENVENEKEKSEGGVNIGIMDTMEKSESLTGTGDWQKLAFEFDSKNREIVDIVFRLGSYDDNSKGTVWFSDFTLEKGSKDTDNTWNFVCFIMKNLEVDIEKNGSKEKTEISLKPEEINQIEDNMKRFKTTMNELSGGLMKVTYKVVIIDEPISTITNSEDYGYYVSSSDIKDIVNEYMGYEEFDHIFVAYKLGEDLHEEKIKTGDWIGLRRNDICK